MIQIDMELPNNCSVCRFETEAGYCKAMESGFCGSTTEEGRPEWCPLKEQESVTEYVIDEFQPTCKACGFRPFAGYIPTLEWMKERGFRFCPNCGRRIEWNEQAGN